MSLPSQREPAPCTPRCQSRSPGRCTLCPGSQAMSPSPDNSGTPCARPRPPLAPGALVSSAWRPRFWHLCALHALALSCARLRVHHEEAMAVIFAPPAPTALQHTARMHALVSVDGSMTRPTAERPERARRLPPVARRPTPVPAARAAELLAAWRMACRRRALARAARCPSACSAAVPQ